MLYLSGASYQERKTLRRQAYEQNQGRKMIVCVACGGSGHYDHNGSPLCSSCGGRGKILEPLPRPPVEPPHWREDAKKRRRGG